MTLMYWCSRGDLWPKVNPSVFFLQQMLEFAHKEQLPLLGFA